MDIGPKRDLLGELISTIRKTSDIKIGLYYSLFECKLFEIKTNCKITKCFYYDF